MMGVSVGANAQGIHFSQYYNTPALMNPANAALMPDHDYRVGAIFRNQWSSVPVPYNTFSAFADFKVFRQETEKNDNWLGVGAAFYNDRAGDGNLSLTRIEGFAAYHISLGYSSMLSVGLSGGYVQRSVNYNNLTFDAQWDGLTFNRGIGNSEQAGIVKTNFMTVAAGVNYAYFPNDNVYLKVGGGVANINQPNETFYNGMTNKLGMRPIANADVIFKAGSRWIINPSVYYTTQRAAMELLYGAQFRVAVTGQEQTNVQLILGGYNRLNESLIGTFGVQWGSVQAMMSYDATISSMAQYNNGYGAMEISIIYMGLYDNGGGRPARSYNCPRF